jgi:hypothetical protein
MSAATLGDRVCDKTSFLKGYAMHVRMREDDHVAVVMKREFPDRVESGLPMLDHVDAVEINVEGLTRGDLENKGFTAREIECILAFGG